MDSKDRGTRNPSNPHDAFEDTLELAAERGRSRQRAMIGAWVGATVIALVATVAMLESCASDSRGTRAASYGDPTGPANRQAVVVSTDGLSEAAHAQVLEGETSDPLRSVPPDLVVAASDTFVTAGQPIEVRVQGTTDITEMALSDGRGDAIPMVRDSVGDTWRVNYRVPLRPHADRLGLAVTAKNDSQRWRRVWLFLQVDDGKQQVETETPDELPSEQR